MGLHRLSDGQGDPLEIWYRFGGKQMGYVGNNGTTDVDYATSIAQRTAAAPTGTQGAFRNGQTTGASYSDFDQSYNPINSYEQGSGGGVPTPAPSNPMTPPPP